MRTILDNYPYDFKNRRIKEKFIIKDEKPQQPQLSPKKVGANKK